MCLDGSPFLRGEGAVDVSGQQLFGMRHDSLSDGRGAEVGNFAELKNATLGRHVKQHHMSYLGDAELGDGTNVGAGTITANFDGRKKHRTTIGKRVFLGVDTMLRAPLTIGDDARTGAGAVVTRDVPAGKLAVGMPARMRDPRPVDPDPAPEPAPALEPIIDATSDGAG